MRIGGRVSSGVFGRHPRRGRGVVLVYHRTAEVHSDPWELSVSPAHFRSHLEILRDRFRPISLDQLADAVEAGAVREGSVAISFDDGYYDNLHTAKPWLDRFGIPAIVFVTTAALRSEQEFWWDELERIFLQPGSLPEELDIRCNGRRLRLQLDQIAHYGVTDYEANTGWRALRQPPPTQRQAAYLELCSVLKRLSPETCHGVLARVREWSGPPHTARASHRALTLDELGELARSPVIAIGAHTVNHPVLSALSRASQRQEIEQSKLSLEEGIGRTVHHFAYPFGGRRDYTKATMRAARDAGFRTASSNRDGVVDARSDPLQLRRVYVSDIDADEFERRLSAYFGE